jgi:hypothetical protein
MLRDEELMFGIIAFGRGNMHDFIIRSNDVNDALTYLWVQIGFDITQDSFFRIKNFATFEKNEVLRYPLNQTKTKAINQNITHANINQEEG